MGKFDGVLLASDLDGTLVGSSRTISEENIEALRYFTGEGGLFTIATGRPPVSALPFLSVLPVNAPIMFLNGAVLYDHRRRKPVYAVSLGEKYLELARGLPDRFPYIGVEVYTPEGAYLCHDSEASRRRMARFGLPLSTAAPEDVPDPRVTLLVTGEAGTLGPVYEYVTGRYAEDFHAILTFPTLLEINSARANKGLTLRKLASLCAISPAHVYAAGDSVNDLDMLHAAALSFVPSDASPEAAALAGFLTPPCDEHSLRAAVAHLDTLYGKIPV